MADALQHFLGHLLCVLKQVCMLRMLLVGKKASMMWRIKHRFDKMIPHFPPCFCCGGALRPAWFYTDKKHFKNNQFDYWNQYLDDGEPLSGSASVLCNGCNRDWRYRFDGLSADTFEKSIRDGLEKTGRDYVMWELEDS